MEPSILYKYRQFDPEGRSLRIIQFSELWFGRADSFNDPFDTAFTYSFDGLHTDKALKWARDSASRQFKHLPPQQREEAALRALEQIRNDPTHIPRVREIHIEQNYQRFGICALAGSMENLLLWAHYANQHTGFAVGLSVSGIHSLQKKLAHERVLLLEVQYKPDAPDANFFDSMIDMGEQDSITQFISTKSTHWAYEQEHRLVLWDGVNTSLQVGHDIIQEVVLGCRISPTHEESIVQLCRKFAPQARVLKASKDPHKFALLFDELH
jgi:hypothetical protein